MKKGIVLSGMRPTGKLHVGHLMGALENWVKLQDEYDCIYCIVDWHALTTDYKNTSEMTDNIYEMVADWLAVGIDPEKSIIFLQSQVKEHAELHLILSMIVPMGWLERNPTLKEQVKDLHLSVINYGLMGYPVLQAADILMYKGTKVPVGEDQLPHLELAREIARRFNSIYKPIFPEPEAILAQTPRLLGIDGRKMSKSLDNCVYISDEPEIVRKKVMQMITDPQKIHKNDPGRPYICSVFRYHQVFNPNPQVIEDRCERGLVGCVESKENLARNIADYAKEYRERRKEIIADKKKIMEILDYGNERARKIARKTMEEVREAVELW